MVGVVVGAVTLQITDEVSPWPFDRCRRPLIFQLHCPVSPSRLRHSQHPGRHSLADSRAQAAPHSARLSNPAADKNTRSVPENPW